MLTRALCALVVLVLLALPAAAAQSELVDLELLCQRGQFDLVRELINAQLASGQVSAAFLKVAAGCGADMHDYQLAADLYAWLAEESSADRAAYRQAREQEWRNRRQLDTSNAALWLTQARAEVARRLAETGLRPSPDRQLALELEYILGEITGELTQPGEELRVDYPASDVVLRAAKDSVDALGVEPDDETRLKLIDEFLIDYPGNYWRHFAWRYKLYTAWQLHRRSLLSDTANAYLAEYPSAPESHGAVSRYFLDADLRLEEGYDSAQRSVELYETALGLDGSTGGLARINAETAAMPLQPDHLPPGPRTQFLEYLGSRYNLARYAAVRGEYRGALSLVEPVIELDPFTVDEDQTLAPFTLIAAQAAEADEDYPAAYANYLATAIAGDSRNRYALQAEQKLPELAEQLSDRELDAAYAAAAPPELAGVSLPRFTDVTLELGLTEARGRRLAWGDVDLDGDPDLLVDGSRLWRNDAGTTATGGRFNDASRLWGLGGSAASGVFADVDNDGDLDIYSAGHGRHGDRLWRNEFITRGGSPEQRFVDVTAVAGDPADDAPSEGAAWLDYDADGYVDLYVANYERPYSETGEYGIGTADVLYHNEGGTRFSRPDMAALGIAPAWGGDRASRGGVAAADYDGDGDQDLFVGNYRLQENYLWQNNGGGTFHNSARLAGVAGTNVEGWWGHTIGAAWGDVDNDGDLDLFAANLAHPRYAYVSDKSQLLINTRGVLGTLFTDERAKWGVRYEETHAGPLFFDANNDGWLDLYITSIYGGRRSFLYLNNGRGRFIDVTWLSGARVLDGWGAAWADYDGDGDLDLAVGSPEGLHLLRNDSPPADWLVVRLRGGMGLGAAADSDSPLSNAAGIGARVTVTTQAGVQLREIQSGGCTGCGNELIAHFGLGNQEGMLRVKVRFPSGRLATRVLKEVNQVVELSEAEATPADEGAEAESPADAESGETPAGDDEETESLDDLARPTDTRG